MRKILLLAGAAALMGAAPTLAKPGGGKGHGHGQVAKVKVVKTAKVKPAKVKVAKVKAKTWLTACPPGLVWRGPACVPPGHAAKVLAIGTRVPRGWSYTPWGSVPLNLRTGLDPDFRYIQRNGFIYAIDPLTRRIVSVVAIP